MKNSQKKRNRQVKKVKCALLAICAMILCIEIAAVAVLEKREMAVDPFESMPQEEGIPSTMGETGNTGDAQVSDDPKEETDAGIDMTESETTRDTESETVKPAEGQTTKPTESLSTASISAVRQTNIPCSNVRLIF